MELASPLGNEALAAAAGVLLDSGEPLLPDVSFCSALLCLPQAHPLGARSAWPAS